MEEEDIAVMESEECYFEDNYFGARDIIKDNFNNRRFFQAGFERGYKSAIEQFKKEK